MQDQLQQQMQIEKIQQKMMDKMMESQGSMMTKLTQLLTEGKDKGKSPMVNVEEEGDDGPLYPPSFIPLHVQPQVKMYPRKSSVTIRPQQFQADISRSMNYQARSGSSPENNLVTPVVLDFDEAVEKEKTKEELLKQLEERWKWIEERFKALETIEICHRIDAKDLSLIPVLVLPYKFKIPEFEKYNGTTCPEAHITMFCGRMTGYVNSEQLLIHCFQDNLMGAASKWYNQLSRAKISSLRDLAQAFMKQYGHMAEMVPDRITLQNMEKKLNEGFRQYAQRWREVAVQVQPLLLEREMTMLFINALKAPFITHMLGSATKSFSDIVMCSEMIESAIRSGNIDVEENNKRQASKKKEGEVNNVSAYNKSVTVNQRRKVVANQQGSSKQESGGRPSTERPQFTPIPMSYKELYQNLFNAHVVAPFYLTPLQLSYPEWYNANAQCDYHAGVTGHSIEHCTAFKKLVERLITMGVVKVDDSFGTGNPLPNHTDSGVNMMSENEGKRVNGSVAEVKIPLMWV
ncbi:uncharacterized protein [Gossypium hirsutum]|uniref:Retrotransposon gag domain-containing protein n=1 Tax=Gossypium hirsutum TaxID=3635 RepID=A0A1U8ILT4_GOSHI|nr:uncharacterized protein LOC107898016 [Gossypium hirsutum]